MENNWRCIVCGKLNLNSTNNCERCNYNILLNNFENNISNHHIILNLKKIINIFKFWDICFILFGIPSIILLTNDNPKFNQWKALFIFIIGTLLIWLLLIICKNILQLYNNDNVINVEEIPLLFGNVPYENYLEDNYIPNWINELCPICLRQLQNVFFL